MILSDRVLVCALAMALAGGAIAQTQTRSATIYRCGPDGRDLRDSPCPGSAKASGAAQQIEYQQPSAADAKAARSQAAAEAKRAGQMEQQRKQREAEETRKRADAATGIDGRNLPASAPAPIHTLNEPDKPGRPLKPIKPPKPQPKPSGG
ncbi:hypothetical protein [Roseateles violae]|uniref:DUF4124 domain-containing protein n=1 Tax=Roseateles violae TaxID=3058042 RepID=A0ABT8DVR9_9BURK|nr:hypothetical protein [Pelomonas sp. PFR6]MDN3922389.1 hypothetical protein [Pelomonas sp. PFR6]